MLDTVQVIGLEMGDRSASLYRILYEGLSPEFLFRFASLSTFPPEEGMRLRRCKQQFILHTKAKGRVIARPFQYLMM